MQLSGAGSRAESDPRDLDRAWAATVFALVSGVLFMVAAASAAWLPLQYRRVEIPTRNWLAAWAHFDGRWYLLIARAGYGLGHGHRRSAAFFPAYPLVVRAATVFGVSFLAAGVGITLICGALAVILFRIWLSERLVSSLPSPPGLSSHG